MFDTKDKKRGLVGTIMVHLLILVLFAIYGLKYPDPLPEIGIPINFGTSDMGSGDIQPETPGSPPSETAPVEPVESTEADVLTQDNIETIETPPAEDPLVKPVEAKTPLEEKPVETKPVEEKKPDPTLDPNLKDILDKNPFATKSGGSEGNDKNKTGDKGQTNGNDGSAYSGNPGGGGSGGSGNYNLGNRNALAKVKPNYECDEYGTVVITIKVNRLGHTVDADLKLKGTTNTASCLVNKAKEAALKTKWDAANSSAPAIQIGTITYHFELN